MTRHFPKRIIPKLYLPFLKKIMLKSAEKSKVENNLEYILRFINVLMYSIFSKNLCQYFQLLYTDVSKRKSRRYTLKCHPTLS